MEFSITSITRNDVNQVLALWNTVLPVDAITLETLEARVLLDENFDENTFLVARTEEAITGFIVGTYARRVPLRDHDPEGNRSWITAFGVDANYRRQGIGTMMVTELLSRFKSLGKTECCVATYAPGYFTPGIDTKEYPGAITFLKKLGFIEGERPLSMDASIALFKISSEIKEKEAQLRETGIEIKPYDRSYLLSFLKFMETEMPADWQRVARTNLRDLTRGFFQPDQIFIAVKNDEVIGYCQHEGAHFGPFGVARKYQGKGIGTVLLGRTLERMHAKGHHDAWVLWTDDIAAKVYQKFGFKETRRFLVLTKRLL